MQEWACSASGDREEGFVLGTDVDRAGVGGEGRGWEESEAEKDRG